MRAVWSSFLENGSAWVLSRSKIPFHPICIDDKMLAGFIWANLTPEVFVQSVIFCSKQPIYLFTITTCTNSVCMCFLCVWHSRLNKPYRRSTPFSFSSCLSTYTKWRHGIPAIFLPIWARIFLHQFCFLGQIFFLIYFVCNQVTYISFSQLKMTNQLNF